jgi:hypothetical protein
VGDRRAEPVGARGRVCLVLALGQESATEERETPGPRQSQAREEVLGLGVGGSSEFCGSVNFRAKQCITRLKRLTNSLLIQVLMLS